MTSCDLIDLIAYIEGEDPGGKIEKHLKGCSNCREELAAFNKLLSGLVAAHQTKTLFCPQKKNTIESALGEIQPDQQHLDGCPECNDLFQTITDAFHDIENKAATSQNPLPELISEQVAVRKKKWITARLRNVLDFQGIKDKKEQEAHIKKLLQETPDSLPKAAFPDDLAGKNKDNDKDDKK